MSVLELILNENGFIVIYLIFILGLYLRRNTVLKELWLAHNDLSSCDASNISTVLKSNFYLQFLDISNNNIEVSIRLFVHSLVFPFGR